MLTTGFVLKTTTEPLIMLCMARFRLLPVVVSSDIQPSSVFGANLRRAARKCMFLSAVDSFFTGKPILCQAMFF